MILDQKPLQKHPVSDGGTQVSILCLSQFILYSNKFLDYVILNTGIYANNTILYSKSNWAYDSVKLAELESDLILNGRLGRKWLVNFNAWKTQILVLLIWVRS